MSEFSRWLNRRNPRYFVEQEDGSAPPVENPNSYEALKKKTEEIRKRIADKKAAKAAAAQQPQPPMGQQQPPQQPPQRPPPPPPPPPPQQQQQQQQQQQPTTGSVQPASTEGFKDFMNDKNLDSNKALTILNKPDLTLTDQEADHLLKAADFYSLSLCDLANNYRSAENFNKTALKKFIKEKIRKAGGIKNLINTKEEGRGLSRQQDKLLVINNDFEILLFLNNNLDLDMISPQLASEIIKEYEDKDYSPKDYIDPDYIRMLKRIAFTDKNLASGILKNTGLYDIERMYGGSKYVELCNEKIKLNGGIDNLKMYEINLLIKYNVINNLTGNQAKFISPQDAKTILMRSDLKELSNSYSGPRQGLGPKEKFGGGLEWLKNQAR